MLHRKPPALAGGEPKHADLDTNMIHDMFVRQAKSLRDKTEFEKPKKFIFMVGQHENFEFSFGIQ